MFSLTFERCRCHIQREWKDSKVVEESKTARAVPPRRGLALRGELLPSDSLHRLSCLLRHRSLIEVHHSRALDDFEGWAYQLSSDG